MIFQYNYIIHTIKSNKNHLKSAVFTFGREDLIPGMFRSIVNDINRSFPENISIFKYYLDRHIEVDGDHHSHLAIDMVCQLCGDDEKKWEEALIASKKSLEMRYLLWDAF
jgi:pyrroloquinoline quinone (PQQ) biosynthesis protein C